MLAAWPKPRFMCRLVGVWVFALVVWLVCSQKADRTQSMKYICLTLPTQIYFDNWMWMWSLAKHGQNWLGFVHNWKTFSSLVASVRRQANGPAPDIITVFTLFPLFWLLHVIFYCFPKHSLLQLDLSDLKFWIVFFCLCAMRTDRPFSQLSSIFVTLNAR